MPKKRDADRIIAAIEKMTESILAAIAAQPRQVVVTIPPTAVQQPWTSPTIQPYPPQWPKVWCGTATSIKTGDHTKAYN